MPLGMKRMQINNPGGSPAGPQIPVRVPSGWPSVPGPPCPLPLGQTGSQTLESPGPSPASKRFGDLPSPRAPDEKQDCGQISGPEPTTVRRFFGPRSLH